MAESERLRAVVQGRVQGVGFRFTVQQAALQLGLRGFAENQADGSVFVVAEGPADRLDELEKLLRAGPRLAWVSSVESERLTATGEFSHFVAR